MAILGVLARLVGFAFDALMLVILVNALLSWVRPNPSNPLVMWLDRISDTVCNPIRRMIPSMIGGIDLSPMIAMVLLMVLKGIVLRVLLG
jgi:YggT family protein